MNRYTFPIKISSNLTNVYTNLNFESGGGGDWLTLSVPMYYSHLPLFIKIFISNSINFPNPHFSQNLIQPKSNKTPQLFNNSFTSPQKSNQSSVKNSTRLFTIITPPRLHHKDGNNQTNIAAKSRRMSKLCRG